MEITHKKYDGINLIIVEGTINRNADADFKEKVLSMSATESSHLWIDCSNIRQIIRVNFSLSDFINYLLQLRDKGAHILLFGIDKHTSRMLQLLKLDKVFTQAATLDDAYFTLGRTLSPIPA